MIVAGQELERLVLTGFMGSGKSTVGRLLAARLGWSFADLDDLVELQQGLRVPDIFEQRGEPAFRFAEFEALTGVLEQHPIVVALGGGAAATPAVRQLLSTASQTVVIHLHAEFEVLEERCRRQALESGATVRPLLQDVTAARLRYRERAPLYTALAHGRVDVSTKDPYAIVEEILSVLSDFSNNSQP